MDLADSTWFWLANKQNLTLAKDYGEKEVLKRARAYTRNFFDFKLTKVKKEEQI